MKKVQAGFTLIELVVVIVILGILAVTALPKFIDLSGEASAAAVAGVAGSISSGSTVNYGAKKAGNTTAIAVALCSDGSKLVQGAVLPANYTIGSTAKPATTAVPVDTVVSCDLTGPTGKIASFTLIGA